MPFRRSWPELAALLAVVAGAIALRFIDLATNPGGLYTDEATEAVSALRILHDPGYRPIFIPEGGGREALFAYLVAGAFAVFGETTLVLRATAASIGVAGVVATWWLGRRFGTTVALVAAGWAAGSLWLVCVSRDGMRNILVPLAEALAIGCLLAWEARPGRASALVAGAVTALATLYIYQPLKLLPLLVLAWLAWLRWTDAAAWRRLRPGLVPAAAAFLLVAAPMLAVAVTDPGAYFGRAIGVSVLNPGQGVNLVDHVLRTLGMFAFTGDPNPRHDVNALPMLGWPVALVGLAGLVRIWRLRTDPAHALVGLAVPVFLLPPLLSVEGAAPHFLRALGLAVPVAIAVGLGVAELTGLVRTRLGATAGAGVAVAAALGLVALATGTGAAYLARPVADRYDAYRYDLVALADAARGSDNAVILDDYSASVVRFLDAGALPAIVAPDARLADPSRYRRVLSPSTDWLAGAVGADAAATASVVARDPGGQPVAWSWSP